MVRHYLSRALEFSLLLGLPAAVALGVAGAPIVSVLFERGAFGPAEAQATAWALAAYAIGIPAHVIVKALNAAVASVSQSSSGGQIITVGDRTWGVTPMLTLGYNAR